MLHSYIRIYIHYTWGTKYRQRVLTDKVRPQLRNHLLQYAVDNSIAIDSIEEYTTFIEEYGLQYIDDTLQEGTL
jgi:hypothetical protein